MAQTYKFGNGTWARKKGSTLAYSDTNNAFKPLPFSFERDSIATRVNKEGLIEVVGNDIPRIDYTDSTEGALLLENSATNLVTYSEAFDNSYWSKNAVTINPNAAISPNGSLNAYKLIENSSNIIHTVYKGGLLTQSSSISIFAKAGERSRIGIGSSSTNHFAIFDLSLGSVIISSDGSISNGKIEGLGNGWYRCSCLFTYAGSNRSLSYTIINDDNAHTYQGDGTSGLYIYGAMLEANSVASSYIPTNGSTVQRAAETCNGSGNSEVFNDSQGVLFADISALSNDSTNRQITLSDGTDTNRLVLKYDNQSNVIQVFNRVGGFETAFLSASVTDITLFSKCLLKYKLNDYALWINGFELDTDTSSTTFPSSTLNDLKFGVVGAGSNFYGKTKEIAYYDEILTDLELETLTSYRSLNEMVTELNLNAL